jgi:hypothetical protein
MAERAGASSGCAMSATAPIHGNLEAYLNAGHLHIDGHDLGPAIAPVSDDGSTSGSRRVRAEHLPGRVCCVA